MKDLAFLLYIKIGKGEYVLFSFNYGGRKWVETFCEQLNQLMHRSIGKQFEKNLEKKNK
jgi:hypothetical protein